MTVVIPTRERPELLVRAVRSVLEQDHVGSIECLVVFDGVPVVPPDVPTREGRVLRCTTNARTPGLAGARNTGYLEATGDLVALCDDDDEWLPGKLAAQVDAMARHPEAVLAACAMVVRYQDREVVRSSPSELLTRRDFLYDRQAAVHPSSYVVRRSDLLGRVGLVDEDLPGSYAEDYEWILRATEHGPVVVHPEPLLRVHWHQTSFFTGRWQTIHDALSHLLAHVPDFATVPRGLGRIEGQLALADAAVGRRREALGHAARALRLHPSSRQGWASLLVVAGVLSADQVLELGRRRGRGV